MATVLPSSIRPHRAEQAMARGFGGQIPNFMTIKFVSEERSEPDVEEEAPPIIVAPAIELQETSLPCVTQQEKLRRGAVRWVAKMGRKARHVMLQHAH